jgi:hypothetical protein
LGNASVKVQGCAFVSEGAREAHPQQGGPSHRKQALYGKIRQQNFQDCVGGVDCFFLGE